MFEYQFIQVGVTGFLTQTYKTEVESIIVNQAQNGWRFIQLIPSRWDSHGRTKEAKLIFERPRDWETDNQRFA